MPTTSSSGRAFSERVAIADTFQPPLMPRENLDATSWHRALRRQQECREKSRHIRRGRESPAAPGPWLQSVAKTLLAVIDLLRLVGRGVELRLRLDPFRRHRPLLLEGDQRVEGGSRHVRRQL